MSHVYIVKNNILNTKNTHDIIYSQSLIMKFDKPHDIYIK